MASKVFPRQPSFAAEREDYGKITLSDGSVVETRVILSDLIINSEDILGADIIPAYVVAFRVIPTSELAKKMESAPLPPPTQIPFTTDAGWEKVEIAKVDKPTESIYSFESYTLVLKMEMQAVAKNMRYRLPTGAPIYNIRWTVTPIVTKA